MRICTGEVWVRSTRREPSGPLREIKGVVLLPGRVLGRDVECGEVVEILLDMRAFGDLKAHLAKDGDDLVHGLADRMEPTGAGEGYRQGDIGTLAGEPLIERGPAEPRGSLAQRRRDAVLGGVHLRSGAPPLFRLEPAQFSHRQGQRPTPSENPDP